MATTAKTTRNSADLIDPKLQAEVESQVESLRADIAELTKAMAVLTKDSSERLQARASSAAGEGKRRLDDATADVRERAAEVGDDAYAAGHRAAANLQSNVVQNPLASLAIAAGIGFLAGAFAKR